jgi:hypothetical protein
MTNRLLLDSDKLIVSKPGIDVLTAGEQDLVFDSRRQAQFVVATGTVVVGGWQTTTKNDSGTSALVTFDNTGITEGVPYIIVQAVKSGYCENSSLYLDISSYTESSGTGKGGPLYIDTYATPYNSTNCLGVQSSGFGSLDYGLSGSIALPPNQFMVKNYAWDSVTVRWCVFISPL